MSGGLNTTFRNDPVAFMDRDLFWDINSTGINGQFVPIYNLDVNGVGTFDFNSIGGHSIRLRNYADAGTFDVRPFEGPIRAYYLNSRTDNTVTMNIMRHADYFFTDTITGCSFLAQGKSRNSLIVSHVNSFARGAPPLRAAELATRTSGEAMRFVYGAPEYRSGGFRLGEEATNVVVTVFGWRRPDGWHFYARRRINNPQDQGGRRVMGGVVEIDPE